MAIREIVHIDEELCDGCGDCVPSCAEGAIQIIDGKAKLVDDSFCDGLGACLGHCPQGAITIEKREAPEFDEEAVEMHLAKHDAKDATPAPEPCPVPTGGGGCPGARMRELFAADPPAPPSPEAAPGQTPATSQLGHWPVQLALIPPHAPFLQGADLLVCADCVPFTVPDFHARYLTGRAVVVGCPKLDNLQAYFEKFREMFATARPKRITVLKMEVPCCSGIAQAAVQARNQVAPDIPLEVQTIGIRGGCETEELPTGNPV